MSALIWDGKPYALIRAATEGHLTLFTSAVLLTELRAVLGREHLAPELKRIDRSVEQAMILYARLVVSVTPAVITPVVPGDPDDDHVIAAAVAAKADLIVSGDRHLLSVGNHFGIRIVAASEAVALIG